MGQLASCKREIAQARELRDRRREADGLLALGKLHLEKRQRRLALDAWEAAAPLLQSLEQRSELADLYELMGRTCLDMGWTSRGCQCYQNACQLQRDLGAWSEVGRLYVQIGVLEGRYLDDCKRDFLHARVVFRKLSDKLWEARSYVYQARTFWRRDYWEEALGYLRYAFDQLSLLPAGEAQSELEAAQQLMDYFRGAYSKDEDYAQALLTSASAYEEAKGEDAAVRREREEYRRDRTADVERLGLLRHEVGRTETDAAPALELIARHGYSRAAISSYERALPQLRSSHNRLAEAIIEGTIALLRILLRERYVSSETASELYLEAHADPLGLGRTHFNAAIHAILLGEAHADSALASLWRAEDLLVEAGAPRGELQRVRAKRAELKRQLGQAVYIKARKNALEEYARLKEETGQVLLYLADTAEEFADLEKTGAHIGCAENFLAALLQVLDRLIAEEWESQPRQITLLALRRHQYQLKGTTTGRSLTRHAASEENQPRAAETKPVFRVRLLELPNTDAAEDVLEEHLGWSLRERGPSEILHLSRGQLEALALDHLDRRYGYPDDDRAVEVLDEADQQLFLLRCGHGY